MWETSKKRKGRRPCDEGEERVREKDEGKKERKEEGKKGRKKERVAARHCVEVLL